MTQPEKIEALLAHSEWLNRLARNLVPDPNEADEVVQEAWMRAMESPPEDTSNVRGWLARVARRVVSRRRRSAIRRGDHEAGATPPLAPRAPDRVAADVALQRELTDAVLELPEAYRDVMLLRYFEDLPPRKIATRLGIPINTVRSRLQRGSAALRSRLDEEHGDRRRWVLALLPLAGKAVIAETGLAMAGLGVAGTIGTVMFVGGILVVVRAREKAPEVPVISAKVEPLEDMTAPSPARDDVDLVNTETGAPERSSAAALVPADPDEEEAAATGIAGLVLDLQGRVAPHVRMRWQSSDAVRWQSGDRGWISGGGATRRISAEDERRAREDSAFAGRLLEGLKHRDEWRATLLDAPLPGRDQRSDLEGRVEFAAEGTISPGSIEVTDADWVQVARGSRMNDGAAVEPVWIATRAHRIEGQLRGTDGSVPEGGKVRCVFDAGPLLQALGPQAGFELEFEGSQSFPADTQNASGAEFLVRKAPVAEGSYLEVSAAGYRSRLVAIPVSLPNPFIVELDPLTEPEQWRIRGIVTDTEGNHVPRAMVTLGAVHGTTGEDGRFDMTLDELLPGADLMAVANRRGATISRDLGKSILDGSAPDELRLVLDDGVSTIQGTLLGEAASQGGWLVELDDPTMPRFSFQSIEQRAAGRTRHVQIGPGGAFTIPGVFDRPYTLRFWRPGTGAIHIEDEVQPGRTLTLDPTRDLRAFTGVVTDEGGAGATISIQQRTAANYSGNGGLYDGSAPVTCDAEGRFRVPILPARGAALSVIMSSGDRYLVPVELLRSQGLELAAPAAGIVELRLDSQADGHDLFFEDASGSVLPVEPLGASPTGPTDTITTQGGRFPLVWVPLQARKAIVVSPEGIHTEFDIEPLPWAPVRVHQP